MPRKVLLVLAAALVAIALPASASAVYSLFDYQSASDALQAVDSTIDPPPNDPNKDFAVGGFQGQGSFQGQDNNVGFSAHSGPLGQDVQGHLSETVPLSSPTAPGTAQGRFDVTCLSVLGNDAALGLVPTDAASNDQPAQFVLLVHDSGLPGGTGDLEAFAPDVLATDCTGLELFADLGFPIDRGNILVNDALP
jgi:hypothetical protein